MKILKILGIFLLVIITGGALFLWYSGAFSTIEIEERDEGPFYVVGIERVGNYQESGIYMDSVYNKLIEIDVKTTKGFGIYWDNPNDVPPEECKSMVGCIVNEQDTVRKREIEKLNLVFQRVGVTKCVAVDYPYKNMVSMVFGIIRVYPKISEYLKENNLSPTVSMEIYDEENEKITYLMEKKEN